MTIGWHRRYRLDGTSPPVARHRFPRSPSSVVISTRATARWLLAVIGALAALHLLAAWLRFGLGHDSVHGLLPLLDLNVERGFGTWYSGAALLAGAALALVIAAAKRAVGDPFTRHWHGMAAILAYLSLDEVIGLHERLSILGARLVPASTAILYSWVVFGVAAALAVGLAYLRFAAALAPRARWLLVASAATFLGGAVGVEMVGGVVALRGGDETLRFTLWVLVEESMEMGGVAILIHALGDYLARSLPGVTLTFAAAPAAQPASAALPAGARHTPRHGAPTPVRRLTPPVTHVDYHRRETPARAPATAPARRPRPTPAR